MSTTISYKGSTIATVSNETKTLTTSGTWLEDDIEITDNTPSIVITDTEDSAGGTIREITSVNSWKMQSQKTVTPTSSVQTILPDTGYDGFTSVIVDNSNDILQKILSGTITKFESDETIIDAPWLLHGQKNLTEISLPNCIKLGSTNGGGSNTDKIATNFAIRCTSLVKIYAPKLEQMVAAQNAFYECTSLEKVVFPSLNYCWHSSIFGNCTSLTHWDSGSNSPTNLSIFGQNHFNGCLNLSTIILRYDIIKPVGNINWCINTPFASGSTGGTIYIPKSLYDHLGDGTSLDYKAAANWSTIDGYGTITWQAIEGSYYETHYADGTLIE